MPEPMNNRTFIGIETKVDTKEFRVVGYGHTLTDWMDSSRDAYVVLGKHLKGIHQGDHEDLDIDDGYDTVSRAKADVGKEAFFMRVRPVPHKKKK